MCAQASSPEPRLCNDSFLSFFPLCCKKLGRVMFQKAVSENGGEHKVKTGDVQSSTTWKIRPITLANAEAIAVQRKYQSRSARHWETCPGVETIIWCNMSSYPQEHSPVAELGEGWRKRLFNISPVT